MSGTAWSFELATPADDRELRELMHRTPMAGNLEVAFLREPNFFLASAAQGPFVQTLVARHEDHVVGVATRAVRPAYVDGELRDVGYLGDLRLHADYRRGLALGRGFRQLRQLHDDGRADFYTTLIVADNQIALSTLTRARAHLPCYSDLGRVLTPVMYLRGNKPALAADITRASHEDLPEVVAKLNENRLQFAPAYKEEDFLTGRFPGFAIEDFFLMRRSGRLAGVLAVWDQSGFRQTVVTAYRGWLGRLRPAINWVRRPRLPDPGTRLSFFYLAFASTDDVEAYRCLVRHIYREHLGGEHTHFTTGLHERDPRLNVLGDYSSTPFAGRLFLVSFGQPPKLEERIPWVEAALL